DASATDATVGGATGGFFASGYRSPEAAQWLGGEVRRATVDDRMPRSVLSGTVDAPVPAGPLERRCFLKRGCYLERRCSLGRAVLPGTAGSGASTDGPPMRRDGRGGMVRA